MGETKEPLAVGTCVCIRAPTAEDKELGIQDGYGVLVIEVPPVNGEVNIGKVFLQPVYVTAALSRARGEPVTGDTRDIAKEIR